MSHDYPAHWTKRKLNEITLLLTDGTHFSPQSTEGPFRYITSKNVRFGYLDLRDCSYISAEEHQSIYARCPVKRGDILLTKDGASVGNVAINSLDEEFSLLSSVAVIRANPVHVTNDFLFQYFMSPLGQKGLSDGIAGQAITRLTLNTIKGFEIPLPPLPEQRAIAAILSTWDDAIALTSRLIDALKRRKQALMQRLLTGQTRFPEFAGEEWEEERFGDVFERVTRKNKIGNQNALTISAQHGLVSQKDYFNRTVTGQDVTKYYLLERGEFAYNRSYSAGYPFGALKRLEDYDAGILSTLYICFRLIDDQASSDYFATFLDSGGLDRQISDIVQEGARNHGLLNIALEDFFDMRFSVPPHDEQHKIAEVANLVNTQVETAEAYLENLQTQKRALMQRLLTGQVRVQVEQL